MFAKVEIASRCSRGRDLGVVGLCAFGVIGFMTVRVGGRMFANRQLKNIVATITDPRIDVLTDYGIEPNWAVPPSPETFLRATFAAGRANIVSSFASATLDVRPEGSDVKFGETAVECPGEATRRLRPVEADSQRRRQTLSAENVDAKCTVRFSVTVEGQPRTFTVAPYRAPTWTVGNFNTNIPNFVAGSRVLVSWRPLDRLRLREVGSQHRFSVAVAGPDRDQAVHTQP